jgi:UDP-glucuronate 4-epimerase
MKILVTGAAGFIGMHTSLRLLERGDQVVGIDNLNDYYDPALKAARLEQLKARPGFRFERIDVADRAALEALFSAERFDRVVHLAAQAGVRYSITHPHAYGEANLTGFLNVLEVLPPAPAWPPGLRQQFQRVRRQPRRCPSAESDAVDHPVSLYAATKKANELMAHSYSHLYRMPSTGLRFFTVYGPWGRPDMAYFSIHPAPSWPGTAHPGVQPRTA